MPPGPPDASEPAVLPEGPLALAPGLRTRRGAGGHVFVDTPLGGLVDCGPDGHAILGLFEHPRTVIEAFSLLGALREPHPGRMPAEATIVQLVRAGAVVDEELAGARFGWSDPAEHARMIGDQRRTDAYIEAIRAAVRPDDIVLDIGSGSGVLAVAAAQAGARHVYAVEASDIAAVARRVFEVNGVADRVTLVEGWSTRLELPERATLLVTETLGVEPFEEDVLGSVLDARHRLLAEGARLIPQWLRLDVQTLSVPDVHRWASRVDSDAIRAWQQRYGIDFGPLREARRPTSLHWPVDSQVVAAWRALGPPAELLRIDLGSFDSPAVNAGAQLLTERAGTVDAILVTVAAGLYGDIELVQRPRPGETSSWDSSLWFLPDGIEVEPGSSLAVDYRFGVPGSADGLECKEGADTAT